MFTKQTVAQKIASLKDRSAGIVDIFTQTINDLNDVNTSAKEHHDAHTTTIQQLQDEQTQLAKLQQDNQKVIDKIVKIFE
jgi:predicted  nucleic acid-binding Zn-ribbon protein